MFTALAYWTAAWTRSAESAQLTSLPIIILASAGPLTASTPDMSDGLRSILELTPGAAMAELVRVGWFGLDGPAAETTTLSFAESWSQAGRPLLVMAGWTAIGVSLARRSMRWEPRA
jgi:ABC-2 type transport system permease protein